MEVFVDGGLFELIIIVALGYVFNHVFRNRLLMIVYSVVVVASSILIIFLNRNDFFYVLAVVNILNSILLVTLLWRIRATKNNEPLFNIKKYLPQKSRYKKSS
jgi:hypothetical protein